MVKKLLVVERNQDILDIISVIFDEKGYKVSAYNTEQDILPKIQQEQPDAVLLDIMRPTIEGTRLCTAIKEQETTKHIPVIVLSTYMKIEEFKEICADEVMAKPFDIDAIVSAVDNQLRLMAE